MLPTILGFLISQANVVHLNNAHKRGTCNMSLWYGDAGLKIPGIVENY